MVTPIENAPKGTAQSTRSARSPTAVLRRRRCLPVSSPRPRVRIPYPNQSSRCRAGSSEPDSQSLESNPGVGDRSYGRAHVRARRRDQLVPYQATCNAYETSFDEIGALHRAIAHLNVDIPIICLEGYGEMNLQSTPGCQSRGRIRVVRPIASRDPADLFCRDAPFLATRL